MSSLIRSKWTTDMHATPIDRPEDSAERFEFADTMIGERVDVEGVRLSITSAAETQAEVLLRS
jgi:hypothetical protein